jgi:hypothetical protein
MSNGSQTNFAGWRNNTGQDTNSIIADPKFVSSVPGTSPDDFGLQPGPPAIANGADLGSNEERALAPGVSWPNQIALSFRKRSAGTLELFGTSRRSREPRDPIRSLIAQFPIRLGLRDLAFQAA